jgi:hypothetical protein
MRLPKTIYTIKEVDTGEVDWRGSPIYKVAQGDPFPCEIMPYSSKLAETNFGIIAEVTNQMFCESRDDLELGTELIEIKNGKEQHYFVTAILDYDRHFEVLIKKEAS